jgi:hypothetical protein
LYETTQEKDIEAELEQEWSQMPPNTELITEVIVLIPPEPEYPDCITEELGLIPNEPIPKVGDWLAIDFRRFKVVRVEFIDGRSYGSIRDTRSVTVIEAGSGIPEEIDSLDEWEEFVNSGEWEEMKK